MRSNGEAQANLDQFLPDKNSIATLHSYEPLNVYKSLINKILKKTPHDNKVTYTEVQLQYIKTDLLWYLIYLRFAKVQNGISLLKQNGREKKLFKAYKNNKRDLK